MKFKIRRASDIFEEKGIPHAEAVPSSNQDKWGQGKWGIEVRSLEHLLRLSKEHALVVYNGDTMGADEPTIVIYDDYME